MIDFKDLFTNYWWQLVLVAIGAYLLGSISFSVIFSKTIKHEDIRNVGSGNAGTTNVFRVFGLPMGALTFVCDAVKGVVACIVCKYVFQYTGCGIVFAYFAGLFAVLGHIFPIYHGFRGGKGVATSLGACAVLQPMLMLYCVLPICLILLVADRMSVMSLLFAVFMIVWHWVALYSSLGVAPCVFITCMFLLVIIAHRDNILRIFTGKEPKLGLRRKIFRTDKGEQSTQLTDAQTVNETETNDISDEGDKQ